MEQVKKMKRGNKALQNSMVELKKKYDKEIKVTSGVKGSESFPFPISITKTIVQPENAMAWDIGEIRVKLCVDEKATDENPYPIHVELPGKQFPVLLNEAIINKIVEKWKFDMEMMPGWLFDHMFEWVEKNYIELLRLVPLYIEFYIGTDLEGSTMRRFTIVEKQPETEKNAESESETETENELTSEENLEKLRALAEKRVKKQMEKEERDRLAGEKKRLEAEKYGITTTRQLSKKEEAERLAAKKKTGVRTSKTGPRRRKFDPASKEK